MKRKCRPPLNDRNFLAMSEAAWAIVLRLEQFGYAEIETGLKLSTDQARKIVRGWEKERAVVMIQKHAGGSRTLWKCVPDFVRPEPLRPRTPSENMWAAMRRLRSFTPSDLSAHATTETVKVDPADAATYCRTLLSAGYLRVVRPADPSVKREAIYRLINETGPQAPVTRRVAALIDPNSGDTIVLGGNQ